MTLRTPTWLEHICVEDPPMTKILSINDRSFLMLLCCLSIRRVTEVFHMSLEVPPPERKENEWVNEWEDE